MLLASVVKELMLESRNEEALVAADEALEVARAVGDEVAELRALDGKGMALFGLARYDEGEPRSATPWTACASAGSSTSSTRT